MTQTDGALTAGQSDTLRAAVDRLIPGDDFPSGWEAGVGDFLAGLLAADPSLRADYGRGLDALAREAEARYQRSFESLGPEQQDELLTRVEAGQVQTDWPIAPGPFFRRLVEQAMEGFYADPGNGGNKDAVSWDMIGFTVRH